MTSFQISGPFLALWGIAYTKKPVADLFAVVPMLIQPFDHSLLLQTIQTLAAMKNCIFNLCRYYEGLSTIPPVLNENRFRYPIPAVYTIQEGGKEKPIQFTYLKKIVSHKLVYRIKDQGGNILVAKFARTYNALAHKLLSEKDRAPLLISCERILSGMWYMVIMNFLDGYLNGTSLTTLATHQQGQVAQQLQNALNVLGTNGLVHGDLRGSNIFYYITSDGNVDTKIIDFDWCSVEGSPYPYFMNHKEIRWPLGAVDGKPMFKGHDQHLVSELLAGKYTFKLKTSARLYNGIENIGNTCYIGSILQCLIHTPHFVKTLRAQKKDSAILTNAFLDIVDKYHGQSVVDPRKFILAFYSTKTGTDDFTSIDL